ncbi:MAG TPA: exodeoxyribonuclease VII small subunit [Patescibacteria group bacterium]|nr:exodeoxyribonuclease VII small subunit [Patescibacteria group bacterium]
MPKKSEPTYQEVNAQLDVVLGRLQQPDIQVDEAVQLYEQGLALAAALEKHLAQAENTIAKLKLQAGKATT